MKELHQFVPTWEPGAIGRHVLGVHETLRAAGVEAHVWADDIQPGLPEIARPTAEFFAGPESRPGAVLLYHSAMGTPLADLLHRRPEPLVLDHHNLTPPEFFDPWEPALAENVEAGRAQVRALAARAVLGMGDSAFNVAELAAAGCARTAVVPVFMDLPTPTPRRDTVSGGARWLFVGRVVPNKAIHALVTALAAYRHGFDPEARLVVVGSLGLSGYVAAVRRLAERLGVDDACTLAGSVPDDELRAHYAAADVFVCLSEHEGFCVPIVEAMAAGLPVVALDATAVGETLGDGGVLLPRAQPTFVAAAVHRVLSDAPTRAALVARGRERARDFDAAVTATALLDAMRPVLAD